MGLEFEVLLGHHNKTVKKLGYLCKDDPRTVAAYMDGMCSQDTTKARRFLRTIPAALRKQILLVANADTRAVLISQLPMLDRLACLEGMADADRNEVLDNCSVKVAHKIHLEQESFKLVELLSALKDGEEGPLEKARRKPVRKPQNRQLAPARKPMKQATKSEVVTIKLAVDTPNEALSIDRVDDVSRASTSSLRDKQANLNKRLLTAVADGNSKTVLHWLQKGADVNAEDEGYGDALHLASGKGYAQVVRLLLRKGADLKAKGQKALRTASITGQVEVVQLLLENGVDVSDRTLRAAEAGGHKQVLNLLEKHVNRE